MNTVSLQKERVTRSGYAEAIDPIRYPVTLYTVTISGEEALIELSKRVSSLLVVVQNEIEKLSEKQYNLHQEKIAAANKQRELDDDEDYKAALEEYHSKNILIRLFVPKPQPSKEVDTTFVPDRQLLCYTLLRTRLALMLQECLALDFKYGTYTKTSEKTIPLAYTILTTSKLLLNVDFLIQEL